jgi:signal transduction histidine kinase
LVRDVAEELPLTQTMSPMTAANTSSRIRLDLAAGVSVNGDRHRLEEVVENLLTNALKYGGESKPIRVTLRAEGPDAVIEVSDQGIGIAAEDQARIFNRFERAVSSSKISGLGLGLYIARLIVEAHGGTISVRSALGQGSTFTVRLRGAVLGH